MNFQTKLLTQILTQTVAPAIPHPSHTPPNLNPSPKYRILIIGRNPGRHIL
ncbi:hypothetical protein AciX9_2475 [Granulicella tundricola MP5ACTX9]|uniref:Uncharacterized protein n=1 Tax=Granulicella tundricola (strain ATCC BAA-1859 / DSM 23138 / MP5ACTX9) TaxID=1198114 RepID=E8X5G1_GRATM|nr:hypothetical protein AciX9_2475 [Granulicella tundricola MP5ACTX9]